MKKDPESMIYTPESCSCNEYERVVDAVVNPAETLTQYIDGKILKFRKAYIG